MCSVNSDREMFLFAKRPGIRLNSFLFVNRPVLTRIPEINQCCYVCVLKLLKSLVLVRKQNPNFNHQPQRVSNLCLALLAVINIIKCTNFECCNTLRDYNVIEVRLKRCTRTHQRLTKAMWLRRILSVNNVEKVKNYWKKVWWEESYFFSRYWCHCGYWTSLQIYS